MSKILLFNPRSANYKPRIPNSILSIAASIEGVFEYVIVDGNMESDPAEKIFYYLDQGKAFFHPGVRVVRPFRAFINV